MRIFIVLLFFSLLADTGYCQETFIDYSSIIPAPSGINIEPIIITDNRNNIYVYFNSFLSGLWKINNERTALTDLKIEDSFLDYKGLFSGVKIIDIATDKNGILHIAAYLNGYNSFFLLKYDGNNFYDIQKTGYIIEKIALDSSGNEWLFAYPTITKHEANEFSNYPIPFTDYFCIDIDINKKGDPIIGIDGKGIIEFDGANWKTNFAEDEYLKTIFPTMLQSLNVDKDGNIWVLGWSAVAKFDGEKWTVERLELIDSDIPIYTAFNCMVQDKNGYYWFGHQLGLSGYNGTTWNNFYGLGYEVKSILVDKEGFLWLSTEFGIWKYKLNTDIKTEDNKPYQIEISNYPNPFNPITTISYSIANPGHASLSVYNIAGQKVATLVNGNMSLGNHSVSFSGSNLASGVYFYRFEAGKFNKTGKMLLVK
jgi:hypothetical protein